MSNANNVKQAIKKANQDIETKITYYQTLGYIKRKGEYGRIEKFIQKHLQLLGKEYQFSKEQLMSASSVLNQLNSITDIEIKDQFGRKRRISRSHRCSRAVWSSSTPAFRGCRWSASRARLRPSPSASR